MVPALSRAPIRAVGLALLALATSGAGYAGPASAPARDLAAVTVPAQQFHGLQQAAAGTSSHGLLLRAPRLSRDASRRPAAARGPGWVLPVARGAYHLTARFGQCSPLWSSCHTGLDFAARSGTPIRAIAGGRVTEARYAGAYGNRTVVRLPGGTEVWYCHQTRFTARPGRRVVAGQTVGFVGATGNTTGPHLHVEVRPGGRHPVDPARALVRHGVRP